MAGALTRWDPFAEIADLRRRFDRVFDEPGGHPQGAWRPSIDVMRRDDTLLVRADLPGSRPTRSRSKSRTASSRCPVSTRRTAATPMVAATSAVSVASAPSRGRSSCPAGVDAQAIKAQTRDGVVEVTVVLPTGSATQKVEITPAPASEEG